MALAALSRARGLLFLALMIALGWFAGVAVFLASAYAGLSLPYMYPVKDGLIAAILLAVALRPNYPGRIIYGAVIFILLTQATFRLILTSLAAPPYWMMLGLNIMFILILLVISLPSIFRILRVHFPSIHRKIWGRVLDMELSSAGPEPFEYRWNRFIREAKADIRRAAKAEDEPDLIAPIWDSWKRNLRRGKGARANGARAGAVNADKH